jgi:hypothetical protein
MTPTNTRKDSQAAPRSHSRDDLREHHDEDGVHHQRHPHSAFHEVRQRRHEHLDDGQEDQHADQDPPQDDLDVVAEKPAELPRHGGDPP